MRVQRDDDQMLHGVGTGAGAGEVGGGRHASCGIRDRGGVGGLSFGRTPGRGSGLDGLQAAVHGNERNEGLCCYVEICADLT